MSSRTPGMWQVEDQGCGLAVRSTEHTICYLNFASQSRWSVDHSISHRDEVWANAELIASSPALEVERDALRARVAELEAERDSYFEEGKKAVAVLEALKRGEYICKSCGIRKDSDHTKADF